jgi:hypothetical protein
MGSVALDQEAPIAAPAAEHDLEDFFENGSLGLHIVDRR